MSYNIAPAIAQLRDFSNRQFPGSASALPILEAAFFRAVSAVIESAASAGLKPVGFKIDHCFCDWGGIKTDSVVSVIDETAALLGDFGEEAYSGIVDALCDAIIQVFSVGGPDDAGDLTFEQSNMILLALRVLQHNLRTATAEVVASEHGVSLPSPEEIDDLCEFINFGGI